MPISPTAGDILDREFLEIRARLIGAAAMLDRVDHAEGSAGVDPRLAQLRQAAAIIADEEPGRAERILSLFSLPYREGWRKEYGL